MSKNVKRYLFVLILLFSLLCTGFIAERIINLYLILYRPNVQNEAVLLIPARAGFEQVVDSLSAHRVLRNDATFGQAAQMEKYRQKVRPGRYKITAGMSNKQLIRKLKVGAQDPVNLVISGNIRTNEKLAALLSRTIEADSADILRALSDEQLTRTFGYTPATVMGMIVPNTYQVYWDIPVEKLLQRLHREFLAFWNEKRTQQLAPLRLTRDEVITLASIVNEETHRNDELPRVAGVYINRLNIGMPLQADPTLIFACRDFTIQRVLDRHKSIASPYNTYLHAGLPPGPICVPSIAAIDAVLNYERHDYLYFCAKEDFSGQLIFAATLAQHNQNANRYRQALNQHKIFR
jgi:UPF0755 protein